MDDKLRATSQKEFQELKEQVTQLEERWAQFRKRLSASIEDNKRAIRRQKVFDQDHQKICSVLQTVLRGTDNTSLDQTDMAVNLERVEVGVCLNVVRILYFVNEDTSLQKQFLKFILFFYAQATFLTETKLLYEKLYREHYFFTRKRSLLPQETMHMCGK